MKPIETAQIIKETCKRLGWTYEVRGSIFTIKKAIQRCDNNSFCMADSEYYGILGLLPSTSAGSVWGTDGGGIGGVAAMNTGVFTMNKSGGSVRVLNALKKL